MDTPPPADSTNGLDREAAVRAHQAAALALNALGATVAEGAGARAIDRFQEEYLDGATLPPSYRDFLKLQDGWERCWRGFSFAGVGGFSGGPICDAIDGIVDTYAQTLGHAVDDEDARRAALDEATEFCPFGQLGFATNFEGDVLFFDAKSRDTDTDERPVVMWNPDDGEIERWPTFVALLEVVASDALQRLAM